MCVLLCSVVVFFFLCPKLEKKKSASLFKEKEKKCHHCHYIGLKIEMTRNGVLEVTSFNAGYHVLS